MSDFNQQLIDEFRANGGRTSGPFKDSNVLLLTTTGRKSGRRLTSPLVFSRDGEDLIIVASKGGAPTHPVWYLNLVSNPDVELEVGGDRYPARATVTEDDERQRLFDAHAEGMPGFRDYQTKTTRILPVIRLRRA
ncbi:MAG TPA: nitroreductase family deazaflavin-dependent oxidoreductase [Candidatus Dormibacteraeota bacterium]|jgi:deazaflavin-dependent oxidoreductase (nitroreductase family)|nr:nitroreductase family deazaflavin-dependent oxidoreductase [Candidatus Dormibacteraeota bacterium]